MADPPSAGGTPSTHQEANGPAFKVILIGDVGVGKTTLFSKIRHAQRAAHETRASATVGVDTCTRTVSTRRGNVTITLWDTAGAERYRTLTRNYYRSTHAALLVFSLDDPASLFNLPRWQRDVIESAPSAVQFLLGNKSDASREVTEQSMHSFADSHNCQAAFLTSARTGSPEQAASGGDHGHHPGYVRRVHVVELYYTRMPENATFREFMCLSATTFLTAGYGDLTPNTHCGRFIAVSTAMMGLCSTALLVAVIAHRLEQTNRERYVHNFLVCVHKFRSATADVIKHAVKIFSLRKRRGIPVSAMDRTV